MAPPNLQGLNIIHPVQPPNPYLSDQDLLSVPPYPDLHAQLDLWTNLSFQSDEPLISHRDDGKSSHDMKSPSSVDDDGDRYNDADESKGGIAETHSHENVVTGTVLPPIGVAHAAPSENTNDGQMSQLDINSILAGFGIDPFLVPPMLGAAQAAPAPSIAQLLSLHAASFRPLAGASPQSMMSPASQPNQSAYSAPKRLRTGRSSISSVDNSYLDESVSPEPEDKSSGTPVTAQEDKRRRNTAASARFRLKKKEREAALEKKAKELEGRVGELEKECEALRRENGWLKGLVVGVTGAGAAQQPQGISSVGVKRPREDGQ